MPIRPELRHLYRAPEWPAIRARVADRAGHQCERCGKPHGKWALVTRDGTGRYSLVAYEKPRKATGALPQQTRWTVGAARALRLIGFARWIWHAPGAAPPHTATPPTKGKLYAIRIVCCVAHLDHNPANNHDANHAYLCQFCHLKHDHGQHRHNARRTRAAEIGQQWLSPELESTI